MTYLATLLAGAVEPAIAPRTLPADLLASVPVDTGGATEEMVAEPPEVGPAGAAPRREIEPPRPQRPSSVPVGEVVERVAADTASPRPARPVVDPPPRRDAASGPRPGPSPVESEARIEPLVVREVVPVAAEPPVVTRGDAAEPPSVAPQVPAVVPPVRPAAPPPIEPRSVVQTPPPAVAPPSAGSAVAESPPPPAPAINVRIGRIVVQSPAPRPRRPPPGPPAAAHRPLADYLAKRDQ